MVLLVYWSCICFIFLGSVGCTWRVGLWVFVSTLMLVYVIVSIMTVGIGVIIASSLLFFGIGDVIDLMI